MLTAIVVAAILSIQLVSVHSATVEKCLEGNHHKRFPSAEPSGFVTCFPWQNKSCCSPETTVELKTNGLKNIYHIDLDYCGGLSQACKKHLLNNLCQYFCDPNVMKWKASGYYISEMPICSDTCDKWFEACKNDKTYSENWLDDYALYHNLKGPVKPNRPCRTFAEAAYPSLKSSHGCIINILDIHAYRPLSSHSAYCISKAGLQMCTLALAKDFAPHVRVNGVAPGAILWKECEEGTSGPESTVAKHNEILKKIPMGRRGEAGDIATMVEFLACNARYVTGQVVSVDGGRTLNQ